MKISWPLPQLTEWQSWAEQLVNLLPTSFVAERQTGEVTHFHGTTVPDGWLKCDGSTFSGDSFPQLEIALAGTTLPNYTSSFTGCVVGIKV